MLVSPVSLSAVMSRLRLSWTWRWLSARRNLAVGFGGGDELPGLVALAAVDVEERWGGLEVGAGEAGVGVGAVLLWWASAGAVGQAGVDAGHVVGGPLGLGG